MRCSGIRGDPGEKAVRKIAVQRASEDWRREHLG